MPSLGSLAEADEPQSLDMPDPSRLSLNNQRPPPRSGSAVPYPTGPLNMPNPDLRPTSAFGINPNLRTNSAQPGGGPRPDHYGQHYGQPQQRPHSSNDQRVSNPGYGRGGRIPPDGQYQGSNPQMYPPPRSGSNPPYINQQGPPPGKVDIGYTAPIEPMTKQRPQAANMGSPAMNNSNNPRQSPRPIQTQGQALPQQNRPGPGNNRPGPGGPSGYGGLPSQTPNNRPPPQQYPTQHVQAAQMAPSKPVPNAPVGPAPQSKPKPMPAAAAPARPPGKGPKTFDEMGVPQAKDKGECVSSRILRSFLTLTRGYRELCESNLHL